MMRALGSRWREEAAIASSGAGLIRDGMAVFTHCHSSTAVGVLLEAHRRGIRFKVFNTETRPRFQGRVTASELAAAGIEVIHMVDSAAKVALDGADLFLFGADAILPSGYLVNKVGTGIFCVVASRYDVPHLLRDPHAEGGSGRRGRDGGAARPGGGLAGCAPRGSWSQPCF